MKIVSLQIELLTYIIQDLFFCGVLGEGGGREVEGRDFDFEIYFWVFQVLQM